MSTSIHTCPRCELRFLTVAELGDHLRADHHVTLERPAYRTRLPEPPGEPVPVAPEVDGVLTIPVDPSHPPTPAVRVGATLARQAGLAVELVTVRPGGVSGAGAEAHLADRAREASATGAAVVGWRDLGPGDPVEGLVGHLTARPPRYVCMASRSRRSVGELLLGSVSEEVLRRAPAPVLLVGPEARPPEGPFTTLVVGIDGSQRSDAACEVAAGLAGTIGAELALVEVRDEEAMLDEPRPVAPRHLVRLGSARATHDVVEGRSPARELVRHVQGRPGTLLVVGTHGHRGLRRLALGSVALDVVRHADVPVLVVPDGAPVSPPAVAAGRTAPSPLG